MEAIGPAVLNGGVTTFLALVLLSGSTSHTFLTFFKVFVLTVVFGLFHGLVLLPVLLSLVGPEMESQQGVEEGESRSESESSGVSEVSVEEGCELVENEMDNDHDEMQTCDADLE